MSNEKLLDSFLNPKDRLVKAIQKDLELLQEIRKKRFDYNNFTILTVSLLIDVLKKINTKIDNILISRSMYFPNTTSEFSKYCINTFEAARELGIEIFDLNGNRDKIERKYKNIKWKNQE